jgi:putative intracellular protease/amidase
MSKRVLIATPEYEYDPSELAIPWATLAQHGHKIVLATPSGKNRGADPIMLTGKGLGPLKKLMAANTDAMNAYRSVSKMKSFQQPMALQNIDPTDFDLIILPGGHAPGIKPYLEFPILHNIVGQFFQQNKLVGALCHGALVPARSINPATNKSCLEGRKSTSLLKSQELTAWYLTRWWLGNYYLTYPGTTVEEEMRTALGPSGTFIRGPLPIARDRADNLRPGFVVQDGNYLSARWPGDCHLFSQRLLEMLR